MTKEQKRLDLIELVRAHLREFSGDVSPLRGMMTTVDVPADSYIAVGRLRPGDFEPSTATPGRSVQRLDADICNLARIRYEKKLSNSQVDELLREKTTSTVLKELVTGARQSQLFDAIKEHRESLLVETSTKLDVAALQGLLATLGDREGGRLLLMGEQASKKHDLQASLDGVRVLASKLSGVIPDGDRSLVISAVLFFGGDEGVVRYLASDLDVDVEMKDDDAEVVLEERRGFLSSADAAPFAVVLVKHGTGLSPVVDRLMRLLTCEEAECG